MTTLFLKYLKLPPSMPPEGNQSGRFLTRFDMQRESPSSGQAPKPASSDVQVQTPTSAPRPTMGPPLEFWETWRLLLLKDKWERKGRRRSWKEKMKLIGMYSQEYVFSPRLIAGLLIIIIVTFIESLLIHQGLLDFSGSNSQYKWDFFSKNLLFLYFIVLHIIIFFFVEGIGFIDSDLLRVQVPLSRYNIHQLNLITSLFNLIIILMIVNIIGSFITSLFIKIPWYYPIHMSLISIFIFLGIMALISLLDISIHYNNASHKISKYIINLISYWIIIGFIYGLLIFFLLQFIESGSTPLVDNFVIRNLYSNNYIHWFFAPMPWLAVNIIASNAPSWLLTVIWSVLTVNLIFSFYYIWKCPALDQSQFENYNATIAEAELREMYMASSEKTKKQISNWGFGFAALETYWHIEAKYDNQYLDENYTFLKILPILPFILLSITESSYIPILIGLSIIPWINMSKCRSWLRSLRMLPNYYQLPFDGQKIIWTSIKLSYLNRLKWWLIYLPITLYGIFLIDDNELRWMAFQIFIIVVPVLAFYIVVAINFLNVLDFALWKEKSKFLFGGKRIWTGTLLLLGVVWLLLPYDIVFLFPLLPTSYWLLKKAEILWDQMSLEKII